MGNVAYFIVDKKNEILEVILYNYKGGSFYNFT